MSTFQFLFSCSLSKIILRPADNLNKTLQNLSISVAQGQEIAYLVIELNSFLVDIFARCLYRDS